MWGVGPHGTFCSTSSDPENTPTLRFSWHTRVSPAWVRRCDMGPGSEQMWNKLSTLTPNFFS